jgi:MFS family permease
MQSLIHGNFKGAAQKRAYALTGASAAIAAAVGPLLGGFLTTYLSWRVGFGLEVVVILVVLSQIRVVKDVPYTGPRHIDFIGAVLSVVGMGGVVLGILVWQEGGGYVGLLIGIGAAALVALAFWLVHRKRRGKPTLLDPDLFKHLNFRIGISQQTLQQITLGGAMIVLPLFLQMTLEYKAMLAGRKSGKLRPAHLVMAGFGLSTVGMAAIIPLVPRVDSGWYLVIPLVITGAGLGLLVSQLNNFTLAPIAEERVSEAAGVNSAAGSFGLSFGLAIAGGIMLWALALSFTHLTETSTVIPPAQQQQISAGLEHDAEVMSNTQLQQQIAGEPPAVEAEVLAINTHARNRSLQVALLVPAIASLLGLGNSFRMLRLPDITPAADIEGVDFG